MLDPAGRPIAKGTLCAQAHGFNLQAATRVAANDKQGRLTLCRHILRPPLANDRLHILPDGSVRLDFKKPWSDGTSSVDLEPLALIARLAALVPPPRRHTVRYFGVLASHNASRSEVVPAPASLPRVLTVTSLPCSALYGDSSSIGSSLALPVEPTHSQKKALDLLNVRP